MAVKEPPLTPKAPAGDQPPTPPPDSSVEKLLWTPTEGEDATKILFPLSRHAEATFRCSCGAELRVHWKARTGLIVGHYSVRCPNCGTSHDTPDQPLRLFRRDGDDWTPVPLD
jgi:hypothetical protein